MNSKREKEQDEHRETVVTGQIEKRSASTAHHISVLPGRRRGKWRTASASTAHHTLVLSGVGRPRESENSGGNQSGDISDDNNIIQSSDKAHDEKSEQ